jgi:outer membrane lipase/esterase
MLRRFGYVVLLSASVQPAIAQNFNQFIGFGDSTIDTGYFNNASTGSPAKNSVLANARANGGTGTPVGVGIMNTQLLASYFGLAAIPSDQGGSNYAIAGAVDAAVLANGFIGNLNPAALPSTQQQILNYLAASGGHANPNALYLISSGGNDITYAKDNITGLVNQESYLAGQAGQLSGTVQTLQADGARYIVVHDNYGSGSLNDFYNQQLWSDLSAAGANVIPSDIQAVVRFIQANPTLFGFTAATVEPGVLGTGTGSACIYVPAVGSKLTSGWGQWCANTTVAPSVQGAYAYLRSANAEQTSLYSDDEHLSAAGQRIEANYDYSLIVAPSQISFLAETPVKTESTLFNTIQSQLPISNSNRGPGGYNAWVSGDISSLTMSSSYNGFPGDPGSPMALTAGFDFKSYGWLYGVAFSVDHTSQSFTLLPGYYTQDAGSASLYAAYLDHPLWFDVIGTLGYFHDSINRQVPLGIASLSNNGYTNAYDPSIAGEIGYNFLSNFFGGDLKQGPVTGVALQRVNVDAFTETGSVTSLSFGSQVRDSEITELGYQAAYTFGIYEPFAKLVWNHEWADTNRDVTASLTTISAPTYSMPAVVLGKDWGSATVGGSAKIAPNVRCFVFLTSEFAQDSATVYGGQLGVNVGF